MRGVWLVYMTRHIGGRQKHVGWSRINPLIFTVCFKSKAKRGQRCKLCLSLSHAPWLRRVYLAGGQGDLQSRLRALEQVMGTTQASIARVVTSKQIATCKLFNEGRYSYRISRFRCACIICRGEHSAVASPNCAGGGQANYKLQSFQSEVIVLAESHTYLRRAA